MRIQNMQIEEFTPQTLHQLVNARANQLLVNALPEAIGLVRVTGILTDPGQAKGQWHYGVRLMEDGAQILVDLPVSLVRGRALIPGKWVSITGVLRPRVGRLGTLEIRLEAGDARPMQTDSDRVQPSVGGAIALDALKAIEKTRRPFPVPKDRPIAVAVIQSSSVHAQVAEDCMGELRKVADFIEVTPHRVNILNPVEIASAIEAAHCDVLLLIRGGGGPSEFEVFDDERVVRAFAKKACYRVIGLGHSGNHTVLDLFAENVSRTPAQAGMHVREGVEYLLRRMNESIGAQYQPHPLIQWIHRNRNWLLGLLAIACVIVGVRTI